MNLRNGPLRDQRAFSLIELLLYVGILGIVGGLLTGILTTATKTQIQQTSQDKLSGELSFAMQTIQRLVQSSSLIDMNAGTASSGLKLRTKNLAQDPTLVYLSGGTIYIQQGSSTPQALTDDQVSVSSLQFQKFSQYPGKDVVQIDIAMTDAAQPNALARSLRSAVSRASAATFDSDLIPGADNTYSVGMSGNRWENALFSGKVGIDVGGQLGIGTLAPSYPLDIETANNGIFVSSTATSSNNFLLNLQAGSTTAFYVRNDGNIGIGTSTPAYPLDIQSSGTGVRIAGTQNGSTTSLLNITASSSPVFYVRADGNIGIGTSTPSYGLDIYNSFHVAGTSTFDGNIVFGGSTSTPIYRISNVATPATSTDVATKGYVDSALASGSGVPSGYIILGTTSTTPSGYSLVSGRPLSTLETSNIGTWTTKTAPGISASPDGAAALGGYIYLVYQPAGSGFSIARYNPATDTWNTSLATTTAFASVSQNAVVAFNNKIYVFGWTYTSFYGYIYGYIYAQTYDPATNTWSTAGSVNLGKLTEPYYVSATTLNGSVYVGYSYSHTDPTSYSISYGIGALYYSSSSFSSLSCGNSSAPTAPSLVGITGIDGNSIALLSYYYYSQFPSTYYESNLICQVNGSTAIASSTPTTPLNNETLSALTSVADAFPYVIDTTTIEIFNGGAGTFVKPAPPSGFSSGNGAAAYYNGYIYFIGNNFNYAYSDPLYYTFRKN